MTDDERAACCGLTSQQSENDGYALTRVGGVLICGECLVEAGVIAAEPE